MRYALKESADENFGNTSIGVTMAKTLKMFIDRRPTAEKARWLINPDGYYPYCSACLAEPQSGVMTDFCPNCGADMRGKRNG